MSKIKDIQVWSADLGNTKPYTIAFKTVDEVRNAFVEITLDNGITGIGSGNPSEYVVGESLAQCLEALQPKNLEFLIGRDIREFNQLTFDVWKKFPKNAGRAMSFERRLHRPQARDAARETRTMKDSSFPPRLSTSTDEDGVRDLLRAAKSEVMAPARATRMLASWRPVKVVQRRAHRERRDGIATTKVFLVSIASIAVLCAFDSDGECIAPRLPSRPDDDDRDRDTCLPRGAATASPTTQLPATPMATIPIADLPTASRRSTRLSAARESGAGRLFVQRRARARGSRTRVAREGRHRAGCRGSSPRSLRS